MYVYNLYTLYDKIKTELMTHVKLLFSICYCSVHMSRVGSSHNHWPNDNCLDNFVSRSIQYTLSLCLFFQLSNKFDT